MNLNLTLLGQMITFAVFVWFSMKYVWPPIIKAIQTRQKTIADGLAAGEEGKRALELAKYQAEDQLQDAKIKAAKMVEQANARAHRVVEEAKEQARSEGKRLLELAQGEIDQAWQAARESLISEVSNIAMLGASKVLESPIESASQEVLINKLIEDI